MKTITKTQLGLNASRLKLDIERDGTLSSKFTEFTKYNVTTGELVLVFTDDFTDNGADNTQLDSMIASHDTTPIKARIIDIAEPVVVKSKELLSIDYKKELKDGKSLHPEHVIDSSGLIQSTTYFDGWIDENNKGEKVIKVSEVYNLDTAETIPSANKVLERSKTWELFNTDDKLQTKKKTKVKKYDTFAKYHKEGKRRRENILDQAQIKIATSLLLTGESPDEDDAREKMTALYETYNAAFATYIKTGKGTIYDDLTNDTTYSWLDTTIPDNGTTQALIPDGVDLTIHAYAVKVLKAL